MKKLAALFALFITLSVSAQEWHLGIALNNDYTNYGDPYGNTYHAGINLYAQKGMDTYNTWRWGIETGYVSALGMSYIEEMDIFGLGQETPFTYKGGSNYIPLRFTIGYYPFKHRRKFSPYYQLAVGAAYGNQTTLFEEQKFDFLGTELIIPETSSTLVHYGFSGVLRLGGQLMLSKQTSWLDFNVGYHARTATPISGTATAAGNETEIDVDDLDTEFYSGLQIQVGIVFAIY